MVHDQPIPWNAEAVLVEASLHLSASQSRRKADFELRIPGQKPYPAEQLQRIENDDRYRVSFRLPPPGAAATAELLFRDHTRGQLALPFLSRSDFVQGLRLQMPTIYARVGSDTVACQTFVTSQCKGIVVSAMLLSPTSLRPLLDLDLQV